MIGITKKDFEDCALASFGQSIVRTPRTKTVSNATGSPIFTEGTDETITAIFLRRGQKFFWEKEGLFESGDAFLQCKEDQALVKDDLITVAGLTYRVDNVITRQIGGVNIFRSCNLFLVE